MDEDKDKTKPSEVVSPKNTEKLYGEKAEQADPLAGDSETMEQSLPEDFNGVDQELGQNLYPSHSASDPHDLADDA